MTEDKIQSCFSELSFVTSTKDAHERSILLIHAANLEFGLKCTGLNEDDPVFEGGSLPKEWNQHSGEVYGFRYSFNDKGKSDVVLLKIIRTPTGIEINAASQARNDQLHSAEIKLDGLDFARQPKETMSKIIQQYKETILKKLVPNTESGASSQGSFLLLGSPSFTSPMPFSSGSPFGQPRLPGIGGRDMNPFGMSPFGPGMGITGPGSGNLMGPDHPFFAQDPSFQRPGLGQFPRAPPGARYDPSTPFGDFPHYF